MSTPCSVCAEPGLVGINGAWFCLDHVDDGFRLAARGVAIIRGAPPDLIEQIAVDMTEHLWREMDPEEGEVDLVFGMDEIPPADRE